MFGMSTGYTDLPLHSGHVPKWLADLMKRLSYAILEIIVDEYGPDKVVEKLSNPLWFQAFNNIIGMDWDSSGSTTVTTGILKEVTWKADLGVIVVGGKGEKARKVVNEIDIIAEKFNFTSSKVETLKRASKLTAKVDSSLLQDNYQLYHHSIIISEDGNWCVVQQGMNVDLKMARRYHWYSKALKSYVIEPHSGIACNRVDYALNLIDKDAKGARKTILDLARENPNNVINDMKRALRVVRGIHPLTHWLKDVKDEDVRYRTIYYKPVKPTRTLVRTLRKLYEITPSKLEDMLLVKGVGPSTIRALVLVSDLIYNEPPSWKDPVTHPYDPFIYAYAFGGKDGVPYPVNRKVMEETISILEEAINKAKIGETERLKALRRLRNLMK